MQLRKKNNKRNGLGAGLEALEQKRLFAADLVSVSPADDSTGVDTGTELVLTFSDPVSPGPGTSNVVVLDGDGALIEAVNINAATFDGATVTVPLSEPLPASTAITVQVDPGAVIDSTGDTETQTIFTEDFESVPLQNSLLVPSFDDYVAVFTGTLDVTEAGEYTFGINSDDGQALYIDLQQNGLDILDFDDEIIYDNSTHGRQDRLSTCAFEDNDALQSCVGQGDPAITLEVGQYDFQYHYFERGGGSGGEFFYGKGQIEEWAADTFVLVGDSSLGIGVVDGVDVTVYKETVDRTVGSLLDAEEVIFDDALIIGQEKLEFADIAENPAGRFSVNNEIPGAVEWAIENDPNPFDWADEGPLGWERDNSDLIEGGAPEYNGWVFLDKDFWIAEQGNQNREEWELSDGTVLVADPDAHDDFVNNGSFDAAACLDVLEFGPECGLFTASVSMPPIYLDGVAENSATVEFASSWWDEDTQSAAVVVEYFDEAGASIGSSELLRWESIADSENYKPVSDPETGANARNELVTLDLNNPAEASSMVVTFDMPYATNDWWWAVDNIKVDAEVTGDLFAGIADDSFTFETGEGGTTEPDGTTVGDFNGDGLINVQDFLIVSRSFSQNVTESSDGDANGDGIVNVQDFLIVSRNFNQSVDEVFAAM